MFASESRRGTHLSWALAPANWWVAREEAMRSGGGWGVCAEVLRRAPRRGTFAAHFPTETNTRFSGPPRECVFAACQMAIERETGGGEAVSRSELVLDGNVRRWFSKMCDWNTTDK